MFSPYGMRRLNFKLMKHVREPRRRGENMNAKNSFGEINCEEFEETDCSSRIKLIGDTFSEFISRERFEEINSVVVVYIQYT